MVTGSRHSAAKMETRAVMMVILLLSGYQDVTCSSGSGDNTTCTSASALTPTTTEGYQSSLSTQPPSISVTATNSNSLAQSTIQGTPTMSGHMTSTFSVTASVQPTTTSLQPTTTSPGSSGDEGQDLPFWVFVGIPVIAGLLCGALILVICCVVMCRRGRRKREGRDDEDSIVQSNVQRKESLKSNLEHRVFDMAHSSTTDTFGVTSPIAFSGSGSLGPMEYREFDPYGSKDPVWSSTPPKEQESVLLRAGYQQKGVRLKPAQSLTTLSPTEPAAGKIRLLSPQLERKQSSDHGRPGGNSRFQSPPRKAVSTSGIYHVDPPKSSQGTQSSRHYALQTSTRESWYDVPREAKAPSNDGHGPVEVPSHYDVPKHALAIHKQSLPIQGNYPKVKSPQQKSLTLPTHNTSSTSSSEGYYDVPRKALATVREGKGHSPQVRNHSKERHVAKAPRVKANSEGESDSLYDVPKRATTLPHPQSDSSGHYDIPKQLRILHAGKTGQSVSHPTCPPTSKSPGIRTNKVPATSQPSRFGNSTSLCDIPASVGSEDYLETEHIYDEPPLEFIQANTAKKISHQGGSRQQLVPNGKMYRGRRSSSHYDLPTAKEEFPVTGGNGSQRLLGFGRKQGTKGPSPRQQGTKGPSPRQMTFVHV